MTIVETAVVLFLFSLRTMWVQRGADLSRARSRCNSR